MPSRVTIFNHYGSAIAELNTNTTRSWILDAFGQIQFNLATFTDPNCTRSILQYGNFVRVQHIPTLDGLGNTRGMLPEWLGIILPPQEWDYGVITVTAFSIEALLDYRPMPYTTVSGSAGSIFAQLIGYANQIGGFPIQIGNIYTDADNFTIDLRLSAYEEAKNLAMISSQDFDITWKVSASNQLTLYANWYYQKGVVVNAGFTEGVQGNMKLPKLTEQGKLANYVIGYNANANADGSRLQAIYQGTIVQGDYGILGMSNTYSVNDQGGLNTATSSDLWQHRRPQITLELVALDEGKTFNNLAVGNTIDVTLKSVGFYAGGIGFKGPARLLGIEYDDMNNEATLTTQILTGDLTRDSYA